MARKDKTTYRNIETRQIVGISKLSEKDLTDSKWEQFADKDGNVVVPLYTKPPSKSQKAREVYDKKVAASKESPSSNEGAAKE